MQLSQYVIVNRKAGQTAYLNLSNEVLATPLVDHLFPLNCLCKQVHHTCYKCFFSWLRNSEAILDALPNCGLVELCSVLQRCRNLLYSNLQIACYGCDYYIII